MRTQWSQEEKGARKLHSSAATCEAAQKGQVTHISVQARK